MSLDLIKAGKAIAYILTNDTNVTKLVGRRIYPVFEKRGTTYPYIVFSRGNIVQRDNKDYTPYDVSCYMTVNVFAEKYEQGIDIAVAVYDALIHKRGTFNGIDISDIKLTDMEEGFTTTANDIYVETMTFLITQ